MDTNKNKNNYSTGLPTEVEDVSQIGGTSSSVSKHTPEAQIKTTSNNKSSFEKNINILRLTLIYLSVIVYLIFYIYPFFSNGEYDVLVWLPLTFFGMLAFSYGFIAALIVNTVYTIFTRKKWEKSRWLYIASFISPSIALYLVYRVVSTNCLGYLLGSGCKVN